MSKYEPLTQFLTTQGAREVPMSFTEIERILGFRLPEKASGTRAWWSNNASNNVMTKAWLAAGYVTERVDLGSRRLVFRKSASSPLSGRTPSTSARSLGFLDRIRAELGGSVTIPTGVDITAPTGEVWDAER